MPSRHPGTPGLAGALCPRGGGLSLRLQIRESLRPLSVGLLDFAGWLRKAEAGCSLLPWPLPAAPSPLVARGGQCFRLLPAVLRAVEAGRGTKCIPACDKAACCHPAPLSGCKHCGG